MVIIGWTPRGADRHVFTMRKANDREQPAMPTSSSQLRGETDLAKVDAHVVQPDEHDELPELTDEFFRRADFHKDGVLVKRGRGRPSIEAPKQQVTMRLDADVIAAMRASGPGWQVRANEVLRAQFQRRDGNAS